MVPIAYGFPSGATFEAADRGELVLGGCCICLPLTEKWACKNCGIRGPLPADAVRSELVKDALEFASSMHGDSQRKGDDSLEIDHAIDVAGLVHAAGFDPPAVAAALLHDTVEDTDTSIEEIERRFGPEVAGLVGAMTDRREIDDYTERKREHRDRVASEGLPPAAIYASDKLANLRSLRAAYAEQGEALAERFNASLDVKEEQHRLDLEMLQSLDPKPPYLAELREEHDGFRADRTS